MRQVSKYWLSFSWQRRCSARSSVEQASKGARKGAGFQSRWGEGGPGAGVVPLRRAAQAHPWRLKSEAAPLPCQQRLGVRLAAENERPRPVLRGRLTCLVRRENRRLNLKADVYALLQRLRHPHDAAAGLVMCRRLGS